MLGQKLPIEIFCDKDFYMLDYQNGYKIKINDQWHSLKAEAPSESHLKEWFILDRLPEPDNCLYIQCAIKSKSFPARFICILVGHAEKYRKYFYPLQIDLDLMTCYLTGQPIYYNFNQAVAIDIHTDPPVLRIHSFSRTSTDNEVYQPRSKRDVDIFGEPPIDLIRVFSLNSPT